MIKRGFFKIVLYNVDSFEFGTLPNISACHLLLKSITKKKALRLHNFKQLKKQFMFHT